MNSDEGEADLLRARNAQVDSQIREQLGGITDDQLAARPDVSEWTLAENLAHIAEFPGYFARQLQEWLDSGRIVMGRVAEHSADRNDAIARATERTADALRKEILASFAVLTGVLDRLTDEDLDHTVRNVKYGDEPLTSYLERYVVGHKEAHLTQLRRVIEATRRR